MDTQHPNAATRAETAVADKADPAAGVRHENVRHTTRFTVIGNHLAQHRTLSLTAIGLAAHIQSLPTGARVDISTLTGRFPEGRTRIAAALRELETHGYLRRERRRTRDGRVTTRTVSCNRPGGAPTPAERRPKTQPRPKKPPSPLRVPHPSYPSPALLQQATALLATLHRGDARLLLSAEDATRLAPGVAAWLEREVPPGAVRHALTHGLPPEGVRRPAALVAHRLTALLPPPPPFGPRTPSAPPPAAPVLHPLQTCEDCDRAFRAPAPGRCRDCRAGTLAPLTGTPPAPRHPGTL